MKKKITILSICVLMVLLCCACSARLNSLPEAGLGLVIKKGDTVIAAQQTVTLTPGVPEEFTIEVATSVDNPTISVRCDHEEVIADVNGTRVFITAGIQLDTELSFVLSAEGYTDLVVPVHIITGLYPIPVETSLDTQGVETVVGETTDFTITAPENATVTVKTIDDSIAKVEKTQEGYCLKGKKAGETKLVISAKADETYEPFELEVPVKTVSQPLEVTEKADGINLQKPTLEIGKTATITYTAPIGTAFHVQANNDTVKVSVSGNKVIITGQKVGEASIMVTGSLDGYSDYIAEHKIEVTQAKALLSLSKTQVTIDQNASAYIGIEYQQGGNLTFSYDKTLVEVTQNAGNLKITGLKPGTTAIKISCTASGYLENTMEITATVPTEKIEIIPQKTQVSLMQSAKTTVDVTVKPKDAEVTVNSSDETVAKASYVDGKLTIIGVKSGQAVITIKASQEGLNTVSTTIPVSVRTKADVDTSTYASVVDEIISLTNAQRQANGLNPLTHLPSVDVAATIRAQESTQVWSHTRPDGSNFSTVFEDVGLNYSGMGENLGNVDALNAEKVVEAWMASTGHKENILNEQFTGIGVGIAKGSDGRYYYTQLFVY